MSVKGLLILLVVFIIFAGGLWFLADYFLTLPDHVSQHETHIIGQDRFEPGSEAHVRVIVRDSSNGSPLPNSSVKVSLQDSDGELSIPLFEGPVDDVGGVDVSFQVPEDARDDGSLIYESAIIAVESESDLGSDQLSHPITIAREFRILLTTDKPVYQPGQMIHMRALALNTFDLSSAANQALEFIVADGKGNKVFRDNLVTSEFGVASADFQLASEVNAGNYKISAVLGDTITEKTVTVEYYTLPKFKITLSTDKRYYQPGDMVRGNLQTDYFFGKPVDGGSILLEGYTFDVERVDVFNLQGTTDERGSFDFEFNLPDYLVGTALESGLGQFHLQASVTDRTSHVEATDTTLLIAESPITIEAIPESGQFQPGIENILYILTSEPDGTPLQANLVISFSTQQPEIQTQTDPFGLAAVRLVPETRTLTIFVEATTANGAIAQYSFYFEGDDELEEYLLLRPDKPTYRVGETMNLSIFSSQEEGTVYLDIVRQGQTLSTRSVSIGTDPELGAGQGFVAVDLSPNLYGTLEVHAYKILSSGIITRDTRFVVVDPATDLNVAINLDKETYLPGDIANLEVQVTENPGVGAQAAIGLAIVDESVFSVAQQDPGFAKLYYMLEKELRQPRYDLHGFEIGDFLASDESQEVDAALQVARENTAQAALADAAVNKDAFPLDSNSHDSVIRGLVTRQTNFFQSFFGWSFFLPLGFLAMSLYAAWRENRLAVSISIAVAGIAALPFILCPLMFVINDDSLPVIWSILGIALFLLAFFAFRQSSWPRLVGTGLMSLYTIVLYALLQAGFQSLFSMELGSGLVFLLGLVAVYAAFFIQLSSANWKGLFSRSAIISILMLSLFLGSCASMPDIPFMGDMESVVEPDVDETPAEQEEASAEEPRLRQYFPETLFWLPDGVTDQDGNLNLEIPIADSITTWRMTALASSRDGRLGNTVGGLRVFQEFFVDLDLPQALTVGDEISVPVAVYNYLQEPQTIRLVIDEGMWFDLLDEAEKKFEIQANEVSVEYFRIKATDIGSFPFRVSAYGNKLSDAVQKSVRVLPNGKLFSFAQSDRLSHETTELPVEFPSNAIPETRSLIVKLYPGMASQVVEGLDSLLRMPYGCFEQTSSTTYPNILILDYMKTTGQLSPEVQFKAEEYINMGYQRLTTFEVHGGGFSLYGRSPADRMLTAYGLQEFSDMRRVHHVDPDILERTAEWLFGQQEEDGSWKNDRGLFHEAAWGDTSTGRLPSTAYISWGLVEAGFAHDPRTKEGIRFLLEGSSQTESPYVLSLIANALVVYDNLSGDGLTPTTVTVLDRLASMATIEKESAYWTSNVPTYMGSRGPTASIETTALATLAILRSNRHHELAFGGITTLLQSKDPFGTWRTTQATILALKALLESTHYQGEGTDARVSLSLNDGQAYTLHLTTENFDVVQMVVFDGITLEEENMLSIDVSGIGNMMYQVSSSYHLPWEEISSRFDGDELEPITLLVDYDRTEMALGDILTADVTVSLLVPNSRVGWAIVDLGIPPGFSVERQSLDALMERSQLQSPENELPTLDRYELTGRQMILYISDLSFDHPLSFSYQLRAKYPIRAQSPASIVYDYYNPEVSAEQAPVEIIVLQ